MGALANARSPHAVVRPKLEGQFKRDKEAAIFNVHSDSAHECSRRSIKLRIVADENDSSKGRHHYHRPSSSSPFLPLMDDNGRDCNRKVSMNIVKSEAAAAASKATNDDQIGATRIDGSLICSQVASSSPLTCQKQPMRAESCHLHHRRQLTGKLGQGNPSPVARSKLLLCLMLVQCLYPAHHVSRHQHHADQLHLQLHRPNGNSDTKPLQSQSRIASFALAQEIKSRRPPPPNMQLFDGLERSSIHVHFQGDSNSRHSNANPAARKVNERRESGETHSDVALRINHNHGDNNNAGDVEMINEAQSGRLAVLMRGRGSRVKRHSMAAAVPVPANQDDNENNGSSDSYNNNSIQSKSPNNAKSQHSQDDADRHISSSNQDESETTTTTTTDTTDSNDKRVNRILDEFKQKYLLNRALNNRAYYLILMIYVIFSIFGALSNSIICLTVILKPKILSPRNIFILNLASSDLLLCIFTMPFSFIEISTKTWPMGELPCKLVSSLQATSIFVSTISITAIALDRYRVIVYSTHQESGRMSGLTGACIVLSVWFAALILALPLFLTRQLSAQYMRDDVYMLLGVKKELYYFCYEEWPFDHGRGIYSVVSMFIQYVIPITIVSIVYVKISDKLQKRLIRRQRLTQLENQHKRQLQLINRTHNMLITVSLVFGLCWLPLNLLNVIVDFTSFLTKDENTFRTIFAICHLIGCFSACSNPVLYGYMNENFRKEIIQVYSQQWQKILRYMCRFKTHSRSTRRTVATTTTTTSPTSSSSSCSSNSSSTLTTATSSDSDETSSTASSVTSCSSSNSRTSSYAKLTSACKAEAAANRRRSSASANHSTSSSRRCSHTSCNDQAVCVQSSSAIHYEARKQLATCGERKSSNSHTTIEMAATNHDQQMTINSIMKNSQQSNQLGDKRKSSISTSCLKSEHANNLDFTQQDCERHHSNNQLQLTSHQYSTNWLGRVLVRGVWFMGSMSSCGDKTSREERDLTSTSHTGARFSPAHSKLLRSSQNGTYEKVESQQGKDNQSSHKMGNDHRGNLKETKKRAKTDKKGKQRSNDKPKTKCLCHCHNDATRKHPRNATKADGNANNPNAAIIDGQQVEDEVILRTRSTGVRPQLADDLTAEVRLSKNMGVPITTDNNDNNKVQRAHFGGSFDQNLERRRSSTDVVKANHDNSNTYKLKTISAAGTAIKKNRLNQPDPASALGQRVWLRFFPSMQKYCFNQPNMIPNEQGTASNKNGKTKSPKHCSICLPSAERRRQERRDERRLRKLAGKEAKTHRVNNTNKSEKLKQKHKKPKISVNNGELANEQIKADSIQAWQSSDKYKHKQAVNSKGANGNPNCASGSYAASESDDRKVTGKQTKLDNGQTICENSETVISCQSTSIDDPNKAHSVCNAAPCSLEHCSGPNNCTIDSVNESDTTRKESLASYGSKSWGAMTPSSSYSCNQSSVSYSTCSCLNHSSLHCNGSLACVESLSSVGEKQALQEADREPNL